MSKGRRGDALSVIIHHHTYNCYYDTHSNPLCVVACRCLFLRFGSVYVATVTEHGLNHPRNLHHQSGTFENTGAHISRSRSQSSIIGVPLAAKRENSENYVPLVKPCPARDSFLRRSMPRSASASTENKLSEHRSRS